MKTTKNILWIDVETTHRDPSKARIVQLAAILTDHHGNVQKSMQAIIKPEGFKIPQRTIEIHGITNKQAKKKGKRILTVLHDFFWDFIQYTHLAGGHNVEYDLMVLYYEYKRFSFQKGMDFCLKCPRICTMLKATPICKIPSEHERHDYKWPRLNELFQFCFNRPLEGGHDAMVDIAATLECFKHLQKEYGAFEDELIVPELDIKLQAYHRPEKGVIAYYNSIRKNGRVLIHLKKDKRFQRFCRVWENQFGGGSGHNHYLLFHLDIPSGLYTLTETEFKTLLGYSIRQKATLLRRTLVSTYLEDGTTIQVTNANYDTVEIKKGRFETEVSLFDVEFLKH